MLVTFSRNLAFLEIRMEIPFFDLAMLRWLWLVLGEKGQGGAYVRGTPSPHTPHHLPIPGQRHASQWTAGCWFWTPPPAHRVWMRQGMGKRATGRLMEDPAELERLLRKAVGNLRPAERRVFFILLQPMWWMI